MCPDFSMGYSELRGMSAASEVRLWTDAGRDNSRPVIASREAARRSRGTSGARYSPGSPRFACDDGGPSAPALGVTDVAPNHSVVRAPDGIRPATALACRDWSKETCSVLRVASVFSLPGDDSIMFGFCQPLPRAVRTAVAAVSGGGR